MFNNDNVVVGLISTLKSKVILMALNFNIHGTFLLHRKCIKVLQIIKMFFTLLLFYGISSENPLLNLYCF